MLIGFLDSRVYLAVREVATIQYLFTDFLTLLPANTCIPRMPLKKIILHPEATGDTRELAGIHQGKAKIRYIGSLV